MSVGLEVEPYVECRNLMLFGLEAELAAPVEASLGEAAQRFLQDLGPLEIVFDRIQDQRDELLFFRHHMRPEVRCLLEAWQLAPNQASKVKPYKKLFAKVESIFPDMKNWYR
jgi:hypothetical protein